MFAIFGNGSASAPQGGVPPSPIPPAGPLGKPPGVPSGREAARCLGLIAGITLMPVCAVLTIRFVKRHHHERAILDLSKRFLAFLKEGLDGPGPSAKEVEILQFHLRNLWMQVKGKRDPLAVIRQVAHFSDSVLPEYRMAGRIATESGSSRLLLTIEKVLRREGDRITTQTGTWEIPMLSRYGTPQMKRISFTKGEPVAERLCTVRLDLPGQDPTRPPLGKMVQYRSSLLGHPPELTLRDSYPASEFRVIRVDSNALAEWQPILERQKWPLGRPLHAKERSPRLKLHGGYHPRAFRTRASLEAFGLPHDIIRSGDELTEIFVPVAHATPPAWVPTEEAITFGVSYRFNAAGELERLILAERSQGRMIRSLVEIETFSPGTIRLNGQPPPIVEDDTVVRAVMPLFEGFATAGRRASSPVVRPGSELYLRLENGVREVVQRLSSERTALPCCQSVFFVDGRSGILLEMRGSYQFLDNQWHLVIDLERLAQQHPDALVLVSQLRQVKIPISPDSGLLDMPLARITRPEKGPVTDSLIEYTLNRRGGAVSTLRRSLVGCDLRDAFPQMLEICTLDGPFLERWRAVTDRSLVLAALKRSGRLPSARWPESSVRELADSHEILRAAHSSPVSKAGEGSVHNFLIGEAPLLPWHQGSPPVRLYASYEFDPSGKYLRHRLIEVDNGNGSTGLWVEYNRDRKLARL